MSVESIIVKMGNNPSQSEKLSNLIESSDLVSTVKLLQNGADPNELSSTGKSCLRLALEKGDSSLFRIFHSMGGSLIPPLTGESMMHFAVRSGHAKLVRHFLRNPSIFHGLKNQKDCQGRTPLHLAALDGNAEIVAMLLKYNANKDVLDDQGKTPRELALRKHGNQCDEVLELLGSEEIIVKSPNPGKDGLGLTDHAHNRRDSSRSTFFSYSCEPETKLDSLEQALKDSRIPTISSQDLTFDQTISRGSSCVVYSGSWLGTRVAIKQFKLEYSTSSKETKKFIKEMQILAQTRHPNLILIMGVCIDKPNLCIISELVPHCSLFQALHKFQKPLHLEARFKISIQIAQGLTYLHSNVPPIVHRDLKPENCLVCDKQLDEAFNAKIADFGLARPLTVFTGEEMLTTVCIGTTRFMAPELFDSKKAKKIGTEVDIWAFGCILIEIFSNQRPWNHISSVNVNCIYYELFNQKPIPIPSCIPKQVQKIIEKCCRYETSERITAAQALEDLIAARDTCIVARKKSM